MKTSDCQALILRLENYVECWKQLRHFMTLARQKKFSADDESQFLELKSVLTQEFELIMATVDCATISRDDVHGLMAAGPSLRYLSELNDGALRNVENQWHKLYISFESILGQLKVHQQQAARGGFRSWFRRRAA